jgi:hypothetical protein
MPQFSATPVPVGGVILLNFPGYLMPASGVAPMMLSRAVSGVSGIGAYTTIFSGTLGPVYVDVGFDNPISGAAALPLVPSSGYVYSLTDATGTAMLGPVYPVGVVVPPNDPLTALLIRLLQAGVNNLALPPGYGPIQITGKMPQNGLQALPLIVVNLDLLEQEETGIGQDVPKAESNNIWSIWINAKRTWRVSILSQDAEERDFYRTAIISLWQVLLATVFDQIGLNTTRKIIAASGTMAGDSEGKSPGFYYSDIMLTADGVLNTNVITNYGLIETITATISGVGATNSSVASFTVEVSVLE